VKSQGEFLRENRVASIVSSHFSPEWIVNIKEAGQTWLVDYDKLELKGRPSTVTMIDTERFLHDGGWDKSKRYFLVAANAAKKIVVIDAKTPRGTPSTPGRWSR